MKNKAHRSLCVLSLFALGVLGPPLQGAAQTTLSPEVVQAVDAVFEDIESTGPGCAVGVVAQQNLAYGRGYGLANLDYGIPITTRSNFYLGSVGKQFTAVAILHAVRAGHLSLDDPIQKWLPEIPEYDRPVTVRHLIHHTSGIRDYLNLWSLAGVNAGDVHTDEEALSLLARQQNPNFPAGDAYLYSNSGYFLLAQIVERATGRSLREYSEAEVLHPLGMTRTYIHDDRNEVMDQRVVGYQAAEGGGYHMANLWNFEKVGSGGVFSSIEDLTHWDRNYYTEEVGGAGFTERLRERGVLNNGQTLPYAFGLMHGRYRGLATIGHGGSLAGFRAEVLRFPEQETTVLVLCNFPTSNPGGRARQVADVVLADHLEPIPETEAEEAPAAEAAPVELTPDEMDAFVGHWRASMGVEVEIRREENGLVFIQDGARTPISILANNRLRLEAADVDMTASRRRAGKFTFMNVVQRETPFTAERFDPEAEGEDRREYSEVVGEYYSEELDATYRLFVDDQGLMLEIPSGQETRVLLGNNDEIRTPFGTLALQREGERVVSFLVDAGRARGMIFKRVVGGG
jgi:CubicO group peptidase (beta-lactamase class C family)